MRTPKPCSSSTRATAVPARPAPKMTTSLIFPVPGAISSPQACAACHVAAMTFGHALEKRRLAAPQRRYVT